ncbi:MAG: universal stress protein, partial [Acidobacteria bacterium]|nr:universal stress protein [Acidobacteriota bacterium]
YRKRIGVPWTQTATMERQELALEVDVAYTNILVPVVATESSEEMMATAGKLAADRGVTIHAITVVEVPVELPLEAEMPREQRGAEQLLAHARQIAEEYGATVDTTVVNGRQAGRAIVEEARRTNAEVIMMGVARKRRVGERLFGRTVDYVLRHAPCRVVIASDAAAPGSTSAEAAVAALSDVVSTAARTPRGVPVEPPREAPREAPRS